VHSGRSNVISGQIFSPIDLLGRFLTYLPGFGCPDNYLPGFVCPIIYLPVLICPDDLCARQSTICPDKLPGHLFVRTICMPRTICPDKLPGYVCVRTICMPRTIQAARICVCPDDLHAPNDSSCLCPDDLRAPNNLSGKAARICASDNCLSAQSGCGYIGSRAVCAIRHTVYILVPELSGANSQHVK